MKRPTQTQLTATGLVVFFIALIIMTPRTHKPASERMKEAWSAFAAAARQVERCAKSSTACSDEQRRKADKELARAQQYWNTFAGTGHR